jgi:hypothetical protein
VLIHELTELTSMLKDSTLEINRAVNLQNIVRIAYVYYVETDLIMPTSCILH